MGTAEAYQVEIFVIFSVICVCFHFFDSTRLLRQLSNVVTFILILLLCYMNR